MEQKTVTALDIANYFVQVSSQEDEPDLTNLKLQKLLYFAQGKYLAKFGKPLFSEEIEAWDYGPVVSDVYHQFKHCGNFPITVFDTPHDTNNIPKDVAAFLQEIWSEYAKYSAGYLVQETHQAGAPWKKYFSRGLNSVIPKEELKTFFSN